MKWVRVLKESFVNDRLVRPSDIVGVTDDFELGPNLVQVPAPIQPPTKLSLEERVLQLEHQVSRIPALEAAVAHTHSILGKINTVLESTST